MAHRIARRALEKNLAALEGGADAYCYASGMAATHDSAAGSLHALTIGGVTFWFTLQNLGFALLGSVFGLLVALAIEFPAAFAKTARKFLVFQPGHFSSPGAKSWQPPSSTVSLS